ncbi:glutathione S-transferase N-terminal domain-containing protein [Thalassotalea sp. PLHSN55]|uniref:glutathione S-transferase N-terminal domain-containing protein n=1 Tax=Thalassotalea sp. PLHSN55 TaxID=3435888 RepID=UPI003F87C07A
MELTVGTDSTWSLRVWICCQLTQANVSIKVIDLTQPAYKSRILKHSPTGLVPALNQGTFTVYDSLAIAEYLNECADGALFPSSSSERALARSLCAELHAGFLNLRSQCPFSTEPVSPLLTYNRQIENELARIQDIFSAANFPFMFSCAGVVDAFYAILAFRLNAYGIKLKGHAGQYQQSLLEWTYLKQAIATAKDWKSID